MYSSCYIPNLAQTLNVDSLWYMCECRGGIFFSCSGAYFAVLPVGEEVQWGVSLAIKQRTAILESTLTAFCAVRLLRVGELCTALHMAHL